MSFIFLHQELLITMLQYSCLENPRDRGAWWASVYGVAQSRTRLKQLSSSSSSMNNKDHRSNCDKEDMLCLITRSAWFHTRTNIQSIHSYFKLIRAENGAKMFCGSDWRWPSINNQFISRT